VRLKLLIDVERAFDGSGATINPTGSVMGGA
jgi:hypothetical protein